MKATLLFTFCLFSFIACKKEEAKNNIPTTPVTPNGWTLNGKQYLFKAPLKTISSYIAYNNDEKYIAFGFSAFPRANGSFLVVSPQNPPAVGEVNVYVVDSQGIEKSYYSTGTEGRSAQISVAGDQLQITLPEIWVKNVLNTDSLKVTANLRPL